MIARRTFIALSLCQVDSWLAAAVADQKLSGALDGRPPSKLNPTVLWTSATKTLGMALLAVMSCVPRPKAGLLNVPHPTLPTVDTSHPAYPCTELFLLYIEWTAPPLVPTSDDTLEAELHRLHVARLGDSSRIQVMRRDAEEAEAGARKWKNSIQLRQARVWYQEVYMRRRVLVVFFAWQHRRNKWARNRQMNRLADQQFRRVQLRASVRWMHWRAIRPTFIAKASVMGRRLLLLRIFQLWKRLWHAWTPYREFKQAEAYVSMSMCPEVHLWYVVVPVAIPPPANANARIATAQCSRDCMRSVNTPTASGSWNANLRKPRDGLGCGMPGSGPSCYGCPSGRFGSRRVVWLESEERFRSVDEHCCEATG